MGPRNLTRPFYVILCVIGSVSCLGRCLPAFESRNDSVCCQCRSDPPINLCRKRCQTGFYPTDKANMVCDSLFENIPVSSDPVTAAASAGSPAKPVSVTTTTDEPDRYTTESHNGVTRLSTDTSNSTVSGPENDTAGSRSNADRDTTESTARSRTDTFHNTVTKGSESRSDSSTADSKSTSRDDTAGSTSKYDAEFTGRRSTPNDGTEASTSAPGMHTQGSSSNSDNDTTGSRPSSYTGTTESRSTVDTGGGTVTCERCHEACDGCVGPGSNNCIRCAEGFQLRSSSSESDPAEDGGGCVRTSESSSEESQYIFFLALLAVVLTVPIIIFIFYYKCKSFKKATGKGNGAQSRGGNTQDGTEYDLDDGPETNHKDDPSDIIENKIHRANNNSAHGRAFELNEFIWWMDERLTILNASTSSLRSLSPDGASCLGVKVATPDVAPHKMRNADRDFTELIGQTSLPTEKYRHNKWAVKRNSVQLDACGDRNSPPPDGASWKGRTTKQPYSLATVNELKSKDDKIDRNWPKLLLSGRKSSITTSSSSSFSRPSSGYISERKFSPPGTLTPFRRDEDSKTPAGDDRDDDGDGEVDDDSGCEESVPNLRKTISDHSTSLNLLDNYTTSSATQTCDSSPSPRPLVSDSWQFSGQVSYSGGKVQKQHSDVTLDIPEGANGTDDMFAVRGAVSVDLRAAALVLKIPEDEVLVSPVAEFFVAEGHKFKKPVRVVLPILPSADTGVVVYHFYKDEAGELRLQNLTRVDPNDVSSGRAENAAAGTYSVQQGNRVVINIDRFSGVCCTKFKCQALCSPPDLWLELFALQQKTSEHKWEVDLQLEIWDNDIKDFRHNRQDRYSLNCGQMVKVDGKRLPALVLPDDIIDPSDIIKKINLHVQLVLPEQTAEEWMHLTREGGRHVYSPEEKLDLKRFVLCENHRPDQPERKDWSLTNKDDVIPSDVFKCFVDVAYDTVTVGTGVVREQKEVTFKICLPPHPGTVQPAEAIARRAVSPKPVCASCGNTDTPGTTESSSTPNPQKSLPGSDAEQGATTTSTAGRQDATNISYAGVVIINGSGTDSINENNHAGREEELVRETSLPVRADSRVQEVSERNQASPAYGRTSVPVQSESEGCERFYASVEV